MTKFRIGQKVKIKCEAHPGPFGDEAVTIDTGMMIVSGFVNKSLVEKRGNKRFVFGTIVGIKRDAIEVRIPGSFFTTALGIASLARSWADDNLEARA